MRVGGGKIAWLIENTGKVGAKKTQHCGLYGKCCAFNPIAMRLSWGLIGRIAGLTCSASSSKAPGGEGYRGMKEWTVTFPALKK